MGGDNMDSYHWPAWHLCNIGNRRKYFPIDTRKSLVNKYSLVCFNKQVLVFSRIFGIFRGCLWLFWGTDVVTRLIRRCHDRSRDIFVTLRDNCDMSHSHIRLATHDTGCNTVITVCGECHCIEYWYWIDHAHPSQSVFINNEHEMIVWKAMTEQTDWLQLGVIISRGKSYWY